MDLSDYVPVRVDAHHTKLVHAPTGRETYVRHDSTSETAPGASLAVLFDAAERHAQASH